jgi:molybdopterin synthase catalytic subunit
MPTSDSSAIWVQVTEDELRVESLVAWVTDPACGAVNLFCGTVRDHSEGRPGVTCLEYEAHPDQVEPRLVLVAEAALARWPGLGRVALHHRVGTLTVGETSVVVAVSAPHRKEAFAASSWCIDTLKATVPIWKREVWEGGAGWGLCGHELTELTDLAGSA